MNQSLLEPIVIPKALRYREAAYAAIKEGILSGKFSPNQPLVEEQIAAMLSISRTPVREALAILEHEGLIGPRNGRGLYVCILSREEFVALFIANETVEPYLVRRAALRATDEQIASMEESLQRADDCVTNLDSAGFLQASRDFHRLVDEASDNVPLAQFAMRNEEHTDMYLINTGKVLEPEVMRASNREHAALLQAITQGDPEAGSRLAIYHAQSIRDRFADLFTDESQQ